MVEKPTICTPCSIAMSKEPRVEQNSMARCIVWGIQGCIGSAVPKIADGTAAEAGSSKVDVVHLSSVDHCPTTSFAWAWCAVNSTDSALVEAWHYWESRHAASHGRRGIRTVGDHCSGGWQSTLHYRCSCCSYALHTSRNVLVGMPTINIIIYHALVKCT